MQNSLHYTPPGTDNPGIGSAPRGWVGERRTDFLSPYALEKTSMHRTSIHRSRGVRRLAAPGIASLALFVALIAPAAAQNPTPYFARPGATDDRPGDEFDRALKRSLTPPGPDG